MYYEDDNDIYSSKSREKSTEKISGYFLLVFLASLCLLGYFSYCVTLHVPPVLRDTEAGPNRFSEERAWKYLVNIIGNGPRVAGSREHLKATRVILEKLQEIAKAAKKVVRVEHQRASGDYWLSPFVNLYHDASNVIAKLESDAPTNTSLLLNCHYDSVPTSPGASDNMLWCAVMMEVLSIMSKQNEKIEHNVIFLFNGAEENPLQTSHTFLQHKWSKGINAVVNLDSGGMGGKASVFQVNEPRILHHYMETVPMPSCQSAGETFFRAGLIPSDTDFRVFRDYGEIPGIDIAFHRYGQVYHTKYDSMHLIGEGVMQHSGETLLALTHSLTTSDTLKTKGSMESAVYWDYLGVIMFTYSYTTAFILDILVLAVAAYSIHHFLAKLGYSKKVEREFFWAIAARILSLLAGVALVAVFSVLMYYTVQPLRYYSKTWLIVPLFWVPFFVGAIVMSQTIDNSRRNKSGLNSFGRTQLAMAATRAVWSLVLLLMLVWHSSTAPIRYEVAVPLMLTSLASLFADVMSAGRGVGGGKWLILYCSSMLPALMWVLNFVITTDALLIPILGRSAHVVKYPDLVMAALNVILALVAIMSLSGLELQFKRMSSGYVMILLLIISVVTLCIPVNPYSGDYDNPSPQRYQIMHTVRNFRNFNGSQRRPQSAGLWIPHMDINNPGTIQDILLTRYGSHSIKTNFTTDDCQTEIMCGLPVYTAKTMVFLNSSTWVETEGPEPPRPPTPQAAVTLLNRTCASSTCSLDFQITGPPHMAFILSPKAGWNITTWSVSSPVQHNIEKNGRPIYYIYYGRPTFSENPEPFNLKIQLEHSKKITGVRTEPVLDFVHTAHRTHHEDEMTANLKAFVKSLPVWIHPAIFLSSYDSSHSTRVVLQDSGIERECVEIAVNTTPVVFMVVKSQVEEDFRESVLYSTLDQEKPLGAHWGSVWAARKQRQQRCKVLVAGVTHPVTGGGGAIAVTGAVQLSGFIGLLLLGVLVGLAALAETLNTLMPAPVSELDAGTTRFSEERTWKHFNIIYGIGQKVAGGPEHLKATYALKELLDQIASTATKSVQIDHQIVSGDFKLEFSTPFINAYQNVSNIIALIESDTGVDTTLLVNCHYDTAPTSPGASDDIIWCAVMVEVFLIMSRQAEAIEHNIVFLFNGAEENPFQGAHGFLKHPWAHGVNGLVNLEAAGLGGRASVFQVNDPRIVSHYRRSVPQPSAQSLGEALFRAGLILSDTDFRIFRDFGDIKGLDIAFHTYGHVYHTPYDSSHLFNDGLIQHSGETLLPLVKSLSLSDTLESTVPLEGSVYYDYVGMFMLTYSYDACIAIDVVVLLITIYSVIHTFVFNLGYAKETLWEFAWHIAGRLLAVVAGSLAVLLAFGLMYASTMPMRYYSRQWLLVPLFWMPFLLGAVWASIGLDYWREKKTTLSVYTRTELAMVATRALWAIVLLVMLAAHDITVPMTYVVTVPLIQVSLVAVICSLVFMRRKMRGGVLWLSLYLFLLIPSLLFSLNISISAFNLFIPILGRSGHSMAYPDLVLGGLSILCILITFMGLSGAELQFSRQSTGIVSVLMLILSLVGIFIPFNPYSGDYDRPTPQRYNIRHVIRTFHDFDGSVTGTSYGFLIPPQDINSPDTIRDVLDNRFGYYAETSNMSQYCDYEPTCGFPGTTPSRELHVLRSEWIEAGPPNPPLAPTPTASITVLQKMCRHPVCVITLLVRGAPHQSLQIIPRTSWSLKEWSLDSPLYVTSEFQGRPTYFIYYCWGTFSDNPDPFILELTLETNQTEVDFETTPIIDVSHSAHRTHHGNEMTRQMADLIDDLPEWVIVVPFISSLDVYVF